MVDWYSQLDQRWAELNLGASDIPCRVMGCHVVSIANILLHAGSWETPGSLVHIFNEAGAFLDSPYELEILKAQKAFPKIQYTPDGNYSVIRGSMPSDNKIVTHFIAKMPDGLLVDSFGMTEIPVGFREMYRMNVRVHGDST